MRIGRLLFHADVTVVCEEEVEYVEPELCGEGEERGHEGGVRRGGRANHLKLVGKKGRGRARAGGREEVRSGDRSCGGSKKPYIASSGLRGGGKRLARERRRVAIEFGVDLQRLFPLLRLPAWLLVHSPATACPFMHGLPFYSPFHLSFSSPRPPQRRARPLPCGAHPVPCHKTQ